MPKILSVLDFYVVFLHASSIFYATDSLPVIMHDEKAQGKLNGLLQHFMKILLLSFLICPGVSSYFPFDSFNKLILIIHALFVRIRVVNICKYISPIFRFFFAMSSFDLLANTKRVKWCLFNVIITLYEIGERVYVAVQLAFGTHAKQE